MLVIVNLGFLALSALLYLYGHQQAFWRGSTSSGTFQLLVQDKGTGEMIARGTDYLFPILAIDYLPGWVCCSSLVWWLRRIPRPIQH